MTFKLFFSSILAVLTLPILATAQIKPGPSKVVCVVDADESPSDLVREAGWKDPNIQGFLIRQSWAALEPSEGSYDFHLFDQAVQLAQENGKFVGLELGAGSFSPKWIYTAGAHPLKLSKPGQTQMTPVPWDPVFQSAWASVIESLGDRYDNNPAVAYVVMSGVGNGFDSSLATNDAEASQFDALGGGVFWSHAANDIGDLYVASFPHTPVILPVNAVIPGADGQNMISALAKEQMESHSGQFGIDASSLAVQGLDQLGSLFSASDVAGLAGISVDPSQGLDDVVSAAQDAGLLQRASFMEIDSHQVAQNADADSLKDIADELGSSSASALSHEPEGGQPSQTSSALSVTSTTLSRFPGLPSVVTNASSGPSHRRSGTSSVSKTATSSATLAAISATTLAAARSGNPIWLSPVASKSIGTGTETDPIHLSTADQMEAALFPLSSTLTPNLVFHLMAGTFYTNANSGQWALSTGWQFLGAGQGQTTIKTDPSSMTYTGSNKYGDFESVLSMNGVGNAVIENLTIDANCTGLGSQLSKSFVMPAPRADVTVKVASSSPFTVGKWIYLQNSVSVANYNQDFCMMEVESIPNSTSLVLKNPQVPVAGSVTGTLTVGSPVVSNVSSTVNLDQTQGVSGSGIPANTTIISVGNGTVTLSQSVTASGTVTVNYKPFCVLNTQFFPLGNVAAGTIVPSSARVLIESCENGIYALGSNVTIENVTVQNVGRCCYEGPAGIGLNGYGTCKGFLVEGCTVKDVWGMASWTISMVNTNDAVITGNTIEGDGYSQAFSIVGNTTNCSITNNKVTGTIDGFFSDVGIKTNCTISNNSFQTVNGCVLAGGQFVRSTFDQNSILITGSDGYGFLLEGTLITDCTFSKNTISFEGGTTMRFGVTFNTACAGSSGNVFSDNVIDSEAKNVCLYPDFGAQSGNVDQNNNPLDLGLSN